MSDYTRIARDQADNWMADYPGFGEMLSYTAGLDCEQVALTVRRMPPDTGGRGSYGHSHRTQEEVCLVLEGTVTFKIGDDVFEAGPKTAVRMTGEEPYSVHNDSDAEAELVLISTRDPDAQTEQQEDFWPN